jgi:signal transduction histidine kinase/ligand-binding sensor domain-containing protein
MPSISNRIRLRAVFVCILLASAFATAQAQYQVESWTTDNGLPQNTVRSILQTSDGYLWFTTLDGVVRYDGVRFTVFNSHNAKGIVSNRFTTLREDVNGDLWIGTEETGITRYHQGAFRTFGPEEGVPPGGVIYRLELNDRGELVVFTKLGIIHWNGEKFVPYPSVAGETPTSVVLWSKSGTFWYADGPTLHQFDGGVVKDHPLPALNSGGRVVALFEDRRKRLWIGTNRSTLYSLEGGRLTPYLVPAPSPANGFEPWLEDREGNVWIVSAVGAFIITPDGNFSQVTKNQGLSDNALGSIHEDREGNLWIGTYYRGLNRLSKQSIQFYAKSDGVQADIVHPIFEDREGTVWIGGKSLTRMKDGRFSALPGREKFSGGEVTAIGQDRAGRIWFGHWGGAYYLENEKLVDFGSRFGMLLAVTDIHQDRGGTLWFATDKGLFGYRDEVVKHITTSEGLVSDNVKVISESSDGTLWIGAYGGLTRIKDGVYSRFTTNEGLASDQVRSLYEDAEGVLWIGSYDGGLTRLKQGKFTRYTSNDGLFNDGIFQILEDSSGYFWISCNRGIYRVQKQQLNDFAEGNISRITSIAYGKADGLRETECNGGQQPAGIKSRDGKLWFPTQGGVAVVDPRLVKINPFAPPIHIESYSLNGSAAPAPTDVIRIAPNIENLEIAYTGLSFTRPEQVRFRYRMQGWDSNWVEADTRRTAYYSHLAPGEYLFTVIAANSDGVWNTVGTSIRVVVQPPFYRTWWFLALAALSVAGLIGLVYHRRVSQLRKEKTQQEAFSRSLIESQERERGRIAAELHDGLSQSLVIIKNRAVLSLTARDDEENAFEQLQEISAAASEAMLEAKDIIYDLRPIQLDRFGLSKAASSMLKKVGETHGIDFVTNIEAVDGLLTKEAESSLFRILQESVNNVVRHSQADRVEVSLKHQARSIVLTVADNGQGFIAGVTDQSENHRGGFGLVGMAERARLLHGDAEIQSSPGNGTVVKIMLPLPEKHGDGRG